MFLLICLKKSAWLWYSIIACLLAYTKVNPEAFSILALFLLIDTVTGVTKVIAVGKKPTSRRFILGVVSKMCLLIIPLLLSLLAKVTVPNLGVEGLVSLILGLLTFAEFYSIVQNIVSVKIGKEITEYDAITAVLKGLLGFIKSMIEKGLPKY